MNRSFPPCWELGVGSWELGNQSPPRLPVSPSPRPKRAGVTLTEVLMALMVMGIGVVSVVTLFPVSLLRSVEATKTTNATLLKQNAEARLDMSIGPRRNTAGTIVGTIPRAILYDPDYDGDTAEHEDTNFVFDPLGAWIMGADGTTTVPLRGSANIGSANYHATPFGDFNGDDQITAADFLILPIKRYTFGVADITIPPTPPVPIPNAIELAERFVTLPDSFITIFEGIAGTFSVPAARTTVTFVNPVLGEYSLGQRVRVSVFDSGEQTSAVIGGAVGTDTDGDGVLDSNTGLTLTLDGPIPSTVVTPDRVIVDIPERRYTWIATVRMRESGPNVSVATFFRRSFSVADEQVFFLTEPTGSYNVFKMDWAVNGIAEDATGALVNAPPGFERGGWMFDLDEFRWWKIVDIQKLDTNGDGAYDGSRFATDPAAFDDAKAHPRAAIPPHVRAIFPQNIIEVYTLKKE